MDLCVIQVHEQEPVKDSFAANNAPQVEDMLQTAVNSSSKTSAYSAFRKPQTIKDIQMELVFGIFLVRRAALCPFIIAFRSATTCYLNSLYLFTVWVIWQGY
jgi:hypothetical protein